MSAAAAPQPQTPSQHAATTEPSPLLEPWGSLQRQRQGVAFGTWVFLGSEALLFGGLIMTVAVMRALNPQAFAVAGHETNVVFGTVNTAILLTSSLSMAIAAEASRAELRTATLRGLAVTWLLGLSFLVVKAFEYREDIHEHLVPGPNFPLAEPQAQIFFALYWIMTALHAVHMTVGLGVVGWLTWQGWTHRRPLRSPAFEAAALYWHLVDIVWVFLYPLFYLGGRT
ncbi:cytochrome c oxidase subunit 3 [Roseomonas elaeocarpi]|uniref:Cytochrome c oxidase subunit 3 n=1 Tax=Roseomonas elaeocarpi TaxID=907779 RepID=A0ABV6JY65_9PROT